MNGAGTTGEEMRFRLAGTADLDAIVTLTEQAYRPYIELFGGPPIPVTEDYEPHIAAGEVWLLESDGRLAGLIVLERETDHMMVFSVAVAPKFQGRGLGRELLRLADDQAIKAGYAEVRLYTNARMERNIALYKAFGYRETGRRPNPVRPGWTLVDMAKAPKSPD
jgi:ribosomal protein S18 acetylase RimI-like enzyme